jgi:AraC-like DNA-binding protein
MYIYDQIREDTLYIMLYTIVTVMTAMACIYLLFRQGNAFARDITPPTRLRRWAAAFFGAFTLNHVWYMPVAFLSSSEDIRLLDLIGGLIDCMTFAPLAIVVMFTMLQDRRRPLWPIAVMMAPLVVGNALDVATLSDDFLPALYVYFVLMCIGLTIYMVRALRQYGRWLRDNYADLEHKEVWQSFVVFTIVLLVFVFYAFTNEGTFFFYVMLAVSAVLICYLLWRVETLSDLSIASQQSQPVEEEDPDVHSETLPDDIERLLQRHCIDTQLYLQHGLTVTQLTRAIGTNHFYLSQYFARQGTNYNAYINDLRINHFVRLYREAVANQRPVNAWQLASESGYRSYSTFSLAFKQRKGKSVTAWMRDMAGQEQEGTKICSTSNNDNTTFSQR